MPNSEHHDVTLRDSRTLAFTEVGSPSGRPIIYCHGAPSSRVEGDLIVNGATASALGLRVIVPDRPGMGHSQSQTGRRIVDWSNDVVDLAAALGLETFAVLGSSGGAPYAAACGALIPESCACRRGPWRRGSGRCAWLLEFDERPAAGDVPPRALCPGRAPYTLPAQSPCRSPRWPAGKRADGAWAPEPDRILLQRAEVSGGFMACFEEACRQGPAGPAEDMSLIARPWGFDLGAVKVPVLLWHGELDRNVPVAAGRYLASVFPNCRATFYAEDAHLSVPLNHQEEILGALAAAFGDGPPNPRMEPTRREGEAARLIRNR